MPMSKANTKMIENLLCLSNVSVIRNGQTILSDINLCVKPGEIVTLVGPNGAGKSTLVKTALGLEKPTTGKVMRSGSLNIGYVPQSIDHDETLPITVKRFLSMAGKIDNAELRMTLQQVGAEKVFEQRLSQISGGEMRRVTLARALLTRPDLLILDEPTSGVDISGQADLYGLIQNIRDQYQCGVLLVSHNLHVVMAATDRVVCLNKHLCCSGTPEDVQQHPEFVSLFGQQNAETLGIYRHDHDHDHDLHGDICNHDQP
jgi:zinc transport system ATP-binding protein